MGIMVYRWVRWVLLLFSCLLLPRLFTPAQLRDIRCAYHQWTPDPVSSRLIVLEAEAEAGVRDDKFLEVPQIVWGINNPKIALARAALTARKLNRTLLMPNLSASLFYKETDLLEPPGFDHLFSLERFNSLCNGFVRISSMNSGNFSDIFVAGKGNWPRKGIWPNWNNAKPLKSIGIPLLSWRVNTLFFGTTTGLSGIMPESLNVWFLSIICQLKSPELYPSSRA